MFAIETSDVGVRSDFGQTNRHTDEKANGHEDKQTSRQLRHQRLLWPILKIGLKIELISSNVKIVLG